MRIVSVSTVFSDPTRAGKDILSKLTRAADNPDSPQFVAFFGTPAVAEQSFYREIAPKLDRCAIHGATSSNGVVTTDWDPETTLPLLGALAIYDPKGSYGSASATLDGDAEEIGRETTERALRAAGRTGEAPELLFLSCAPGKEEAFLSGVRSIVGANTQIIGASSADDDLTGQWTQFSPEGFHQEGAVVSVLFPSCSITTACDCGYEPTPSHGVVTSADQRRIQSINGQPAARVYGRWTGVVAPVTADGTFSAGLIPHRMAPPLGRILGQSSEAPDYALIQPYQVFEDGSLGVMADIREGERLWCMKGDTETLASRVSILTELASFGQDDPPRAGLVVFCGTSTLKDEATKRRLARELRDSFGDIPSLGVFSFGQQWMHESGGFAHANQMMLCAIFR